MTYRAFLNIVIWVVSALAISAAETEEPTSLQSGNNAPAITERLNVSIVTAAPGKEVYQLEGHSALRMRKEVSDTTMHGGWRQAYDVAVNWGVFDFNSPNFIYRFVKGETDYMAMAFPFWLFLEEYRKEGRRVVEQDINLTREEAFRLEALIKDNLLPQNRTYRYNYVKDNCATRPLAIIEAAIGDTISLNQTPTDKGEDNAACTFRNEMTRYHRNYPWYQFGIDMALGSGIDYPIAQRERTFAPVFLEKALSNATRPVADGNRAPLVTGSRILHDVPEDNAQLHATPLPLTPIVLSTCLLATTFMISIADIKRNRLTRWFDTLLYSSFFLCGCLLTFLIFISTHEATSPNWLYLWLNPFCIIAAFGIWIKSCKRVVYWYQICNFAALMLLLVGHKVLGQALNPAFPILIVCDAFRSATQIYACRCNIIK